MCRKIASHPGSDGAKRALRDRFCASCAFSRPITPDDLAAKRRRKRKRGTGRPDFSFSLTNNQNGIAIFQPSNGVERLSPRIRLNLAFEL